MDKAVIGVVGTGLMGVGIATQSALHGHRTIVHDVDPARLASVAPKAEAVLDELIDCGRIDMVPNTRRSRASRRMRNSTLWRRRNS